ncbi:1971_t:CDS:2 [Paraglomus occultum]|uniref:1971_t:CDS:1 n=1 Tax=Paraglomus occultum TaxID=144539 RepID=A0A9N9BFN3_9GLOM|nr:1971_t:CDS:2 [Paraglomus occultum]
MPSATVETNLPDLCAVQATTATDVSAGISDTINITKIITENLISEKLADKTVIDCSSNATSGTPKSPSLPTKTAKPENSNNSDKNKHPDIERKPSKSKQTSIKGLPGDAAISTSSQANSRTSKLTRSPSGRSKETTVERRTSRRDKKNATAKNSDANKSRTKAVKSPNPDDKQQTSSERSVNTTSDVRSTTPPSTSQSKQASRRKTDTPPHLNLAFKTDPQSKESSGRSPAVSPKVRELRKSEALQNKSSGDESASDRRKTSSRSTGNTTTGLASKRRHWSVARHAIKTTAAVRSKGESVDKELLKRLEQENSQLPPQNSTQFLLARLERQNEILDNDPKSVCIQSNVLKANFETVQSLIDDTSPTEEVFEYDITAGPEDDDANTVDWEFWTALIQDYTAVATKLPHLLAAKLQQGLPPKLRGLIWQSMCQASSTYLETMYSQLLEESSPYDRIIQRDLARTFPNVDLFKKEGGEGQTKLWNILRAYSLYDPLVGYCQGLGFLVGPLLMQMDEAQAFAVFVRLMETYDMRSMFTLNMEGLQLRLYQFSTLLGQILPRLHAHFQLHGVHAAMFASQWFLSLFAYTYPLPLVLRIYDVVFAEGAPETIMRVAIALLKKNETQLLDFGEFEDLLDFLTTKLYVAYDEKPTGLIKDAMALSSVITKVKMDELSESYVKELEDQKKRADELVAVRFGGRFGRSKEKKEEKKSEKSTKKRWSFAALPSRSSVSASASLLQQAVFSASDISAPSSDTESNTTSLVASTNVSKESTGILHQQIEDLVTALSQLQKEHAEVTDQLVAIKMEKMDLVNEIETLRNRVREYERGNKRTSTASSLFSLDSAIASNEGDASSRRTSVGSASSSTNNVESDITPRQSTEVPKPRSVSDADAVMKPRRSSASSFMSLSRLTSSFSSAASDTSFVSRQSSTDTITSTSGVCDADGTDEQSYHIVCRGDCENARRAEELEHMLADLKLRLAESENARDDMNSQLEGLNMLINGFTEEDDPTMTTILASSPAPGKRGSFEKRESYEKRGLRNSISNFFTA